MDSLKYKARLDYTTNTLPQVNEREVEPQLLHSTAPYMPLYDQELGNQMQNHPAYPVPQPPQIVRPAQQISTPFEQPSQPLSKKDLKKKMKKSKKGIVKSLKAMKVMLILKVFGIIAASFVLFSQEPIAPGSEFCIGLLVLSTLFYGANIKFGKKAIKKKGKKILPHTRLIMFNFALYFITLACASLIALDIIHFSAHSHDLKDKTIQTPIDFGGLPPHHGMEGPPGWHQKGHKGHHPPPPPMFEPQVITINNAQSFPDSSPNLSFDEIFTLVFQPTPMNSTINTIEIQNLNGDNFVVDQAFQGLPDEEISNFDTVLDQMIQDLLNEPMPDFEFFEIKQDPSDYSWIDDLSMDNIMEDFMKDFESSPFLESLDSDDFWNNDFSDSLDIFWSTELPKEGGHRLLKEHDGRHKKRKGGKKHHKGKHGKKHGGRKGHKKNRHHKEDKAVAQEIEMFEQPIILMPSKYRLQTKSSHIFKVFFIRIPVILILFIDENGKHSFDVEEAFFSFTLFMATIVFLDAFLSALLVKKLYTMHILFQEKNEISVGGSKSSKKSKKNKKAKKAQRLEESKEEQKEDLEAPIYEEPIINEEPLQAPEINSSIQSVASEESLIRHAPVEEPAPQPEVHQVAPQVPANYPPALQINGQTFVPVKVSDLAKYQVAPGQAFYLSQN